MKLILPGDPLFHQTLATAPPPGWKNHPTQTDGNLMLIARAGSGLLQPASTNQVYEYLEEEYDQRLEENEMWDEYYEDSGMIW